MQLSSILLAIIISSMQLSAVSTYLSIVSTYRYTYTSIFLYPINTTLYRSRPLYIITDNLSLSCSFTGNQQKKEVVLTTKIKGYPATLEIISDYNSIGQLSVSIILFKPRISTTTRPLRTLSTVRYITKTRNANRVATILYSIFL